jgi:hypothetical protein
VTVLVSHEDEPPFVRQIDDLDVLITHEQRAEFIAIEGLAPDVLTSYDGSTGGASAAGTFVHHQVAAAGTWVINHNLGRKVEPTIVLAADVTAPVYPDFALTDDNNCTVVFPSPESGFAYFN